MCIKATEACKNRKNTFGKYEKSKGVKFPILVIHMKCSVPKTSLIYVQWLNPISLLKGRLTQC
jgi:hypothetical protein